MRILAFAASVRKNSLNRKLIAAATEIARANGAEVDLADFRAFEMPLYDGDLNEQSGLPAGALELKRRIELADALMISAPEYNYSIAGPLKNAIDWVSRARPIPWRGISVYLMAASPSTIGGIRGLWQTRIPLEGCGALVFPDMFALPNAHEAFDDQGRLREPAAAERLQKEVVGFLRMAEAMIPVCVRPESDEAKARSRAIAAALESETDLQSQGS